MVGHYGMSKRLGPVFYEHRTSHPFLGQQLALEGSTSDATVHTIEEETARMLNEALVTTRQVLSTHRAALDGLVTALLEHETLEKDELTRCLSEASGPISAASANAAAAPVEVEPAPVTPIPGLASIR